jgi:hypothetical protein
MINDDCPRCYGDGIIAGFPEGVSGKVEAVQCPLCSGTGKRPVKMDSVQRPGRRGEALKK